MHGLDLGALAAAVAHARPCARRHSTVGCSSRRQPLLGSAAHLLAVHQLRALGGQAAAATGAPRHVQVRLILLDLRGSRRVWQDMIGCDHAITCPLVWLHGSRFRLHPRTGPACVRQARRARPACLDAALGPLLDALDRLAAGAHHQLHLVRGDLRRRLGVGGGAALGAQADGGMPPARMLREPGRLSRTPRCRQRRPCGPSLRPPRLRPTWISMSAFSSCSSSISSCSALGSLPPCGADRGGWVGGRQAGTRSAPEGPWAALSGKRKVGAGGGRGGRQGDAWGGE